MAEKLYPFCWNSRRWLTVPFFMNLPKSCPYEEEKDCQDESCAYFGWREATPYLERLIKIFKDWGCDITYCKEEREG